MTVDHRVQFRLEDVFEHGYHATHLIMGEGKYARRYIITGVDQPYPRPWEQVSVYGYYRPDVELTLSLAPVAAVPKFQYPKKRSWAKAMGLHKPPPWSAFCSRGPCCLADGHDGRCTM